MNSQLPHPRITFFVIARIFILTLGVLFSTFGVIIMFGTGFFSSMIPEIASIQETGVLINSGFTLLTMTMLMLPGLILSILYIFKSPAQVKISRKSTMFLPNLLLVGWMLLMTGTYFIAQNAGISRWLLPIIQIPAVLIPIFWLYRLSIRKQTPRTPERNWSLLGLNLTLQPILVVVLELLFLVIILFFAGLWISQRPELVEELTIQYNQLIATNLNPNTVNRIIEPYLKNPVILFTILFFISGLVPISEELVKSILVWRWLKNPLTPGEGFLIGLIGGSAFTLWENFNALTNVASASWFYVVVARYGTSIIHMSTAALLGWALMKTFKDRQYWRTGLAYFTVICIHGLWNFATMLEVLSEFQINIDQFPIQLASISPYVLVFLLMVGLMILVGGSFTLFGEKALSNSV
ncbi:MAG: PrsW family intramembrane metalloprotease [Anaerolineaceae bacterium]|nr:PrsW family intramembrane metalloprotease [Anaerolineaceae bacterium]